MSAPRVFSRALIREGITHRVILSGLKELLRSAPHAVVWCSPHPPHPANPQRSQVRAGEPRAWSPVRFAIIDCFTALAENSTPWSFLNASRPNRGRFAACPRRSERGGGSPSASSHAVVWCSPHPPLRGPPSPIGEGLRAPPRALKQRENKRSRRQTSVCRLVSR